MGRPSNWMREITSRVLRCGRLGIPGIIAIRYARIFRQRQRTLGSDLPTVQKATSNRYLPENSREGPLAQIRRIVAVLPVAFLAS